MAVRRIILCFSTLFILFSTNAQTQRTIVDYTLNLVSKSNFEPNTLSLFSKHTLKDNSRSEINDSINFILGVYFHKNSNYKNSELHLNKIDISSTLLNQAILYNCVNNFRTDAHLSFSKKIINIDTTYEYYYESRVFYEYVNNKFLYKDKKMAITRFSFNNDKLNEELNYVNKQFILLAKNKQKSPALAGTFSAIIPGSGKLYAGYKGQALASFLRVGILGAVTTENIINKGFLNVQTIIFSSLFTFFYTGDIVGSVFAVKRKKKEIEKNIKYNIGTSLYSVANY
jgi:hypothetical protein